jgi:hypothetical protein
MNRCKSEIVGIVMSVLMVTTLITCVSIVLPGCSGGGGGGEGGTNPPPVPTLVSIAVTPAGPIISKGGTQQFTALGTYSDSTTQDLTASAIWSSAAITVATISNSAGSNGNATSISEGTTVITAASGTVSNSTILTVKPVGYVWTARTSGTGNTLNGIIWDGTKFFAVGASGTIITSPDGIVWTTQNTGSTSNYLYDIAWSGTRYVAVGGSGITSSADGLIWTTQNPAGSSNLHGVTWSGTQFVAVGTGGIITSPDGLNWTDQSSGIMTVHSLFGVASSGTGTLVAVGNDGNIPVGVCGGPAGTVPGLVLTSPDGVSWTKQTSNSTEFLERVVWSGTQFMAMGVNGAIITSPDAVTWTKQSAGTSGNIMGAVWNGTTFLTVAFEPNGCGAAGPGLVLISSDGANWNAVAQPASYLYTVAWSGTKYVAAGINGAIFTSP